MKIIAILAITLCLPPAIRATKLLGEAPPPPTLGAAPTSPLPTPRQLTRSDPYEYETPADIDKNTYLVLDAEERQKLLDDTIAEELTPIDNESNPAFAQATSAELPPNSINPASFWEKKPGKSINFIHFNDVYDIRYQAFWVRLLKMYTNILQNPSIIFSGDILGPSLVSKAMLQAGHQFQKLFHDFRIDVSVPGNHEGDQSEANFVAFTKHNFVDPKTPADTNCVHIDSATLTKKDVKKKPGVWLLANVRPKFWEKKGFKRANSPFWGNLKGSMILKMNGFKVGLMGLVDEAWINGSGLKVVKDQYIYEDFKKTAREVSKRLKDAGCHFVVAVTHMTNVDDEALLADSTNHIDFVFGGHEHIFLIQRVNNRVMLKSGADFKQFSAIRFELFKTKDEIDNYVKEANSKIAEGVAPAAQCDDKFKPFILDELNEAQMKERHWHFASEYKYDPPKKPDSEELLYAGDAEIAEYKYLNIYVERVDVSFADPSLQDPEFRADFEDNYLKLIKEHMVPAFQFRGPVDAREPQIYAGEMPIGDFLTDVIRADTFADIVMLNAGSVKSEWAFPAKSVVLQADAMRMLQRPSIAIRTIPRLGTVRKLFSKYLRKIGSPDFPYFSGIQIEFNPKKAGEDAVTFKTDEHNGRVIDGFDDRYQFYSLEFTTQQVSEDLIEENFEKEIEKTRAEWVEARKKADTLVENMDLYEEWTKLPQDDQLKPPGPVDRLQVLDRNLRAVRADAMTTALTAAMSAGFKAQELKSRLASPGSTEKNDPSFQAKIKRDLVEQTRRLYFPNSNEFFDVGPRPYTCLERFYKSLQKQLTEFSLEKFWRPCVKVSPEEFQGIWKMNMPKDVKEMVDEISLQVSCADLNKNVKRFDDSVPKGEINHRVLASFRTITDESKRRFYNFLSLNNAYTFLVVNVDNPSTKTADDKVKVIEVGPINRRRLTIQKNRMDV